MPSKKKPAEQSDHPFLKTAAEALGSAIGKLAVKTGVVKPAPVTQKPAKAPAATKSSAKKVRTSRKKAAPKTAR